MDLYRIKTPTIAVTHETGKAALVTLERGTEVRTRKAGPKLPQTGMVDVEIVSDGTVVAMFMQDLESRAERIDATESGTHA